LRHQIIVPSELAGVGVEAAEGDIINPRRQAAGDHGGDGLEAGAEFIAG